MRKVYKALVVAFMLVASSVSAGGVEILGAGATFPFPLYSKMFDVYHKQYGVKVNYQSIGSGGGIRQLLGKTVDFGATDAFMNDTKLKKADAPIVHIPMCLGAVVVTYNIPGNPTLKLNSDVLAAIFLGKIKKWNDPKIVALNPEVKLPKLGIAVVHRSDGSGTSFIFTDYLSKVSTEWNSKVSRGKSVKWPVGLGAKGNEGVSGLVKQVKGGIGYCELAYAIHNNMPAAIIKNKKGNWIKPEIKTISDAAAGEIPADTRVTLTNTDSDNGYPISSFTWIILYNDQSYNKRTLGQAKEVLKLLNWMIHDGQKYAAPLLYAPLPDGAIKKAEKIINGVKFSGAVVGVK